MKSAALILAGLALLALGAMQAYQLGRESGLAEGYANGRERERELWEAKPPPEAKIVRIEVDKVIPGPVQKVEQYIPVPGKVQQIEVERTIVGPERLLRVGCVGGCKCSEDEK